MSIHEQARAEAEKRRPETGDLTEYQHTRNEGWRDGFEDGFLAGHEAATTLGEPDLLDAITDPDDLRGRVRAVMRALRNIEAERDSWHQAALTATAGESRAERERDEARGKLDKVRARLDSWDATALRDVLAILDD